MAQEMLQGWMKEQALKGPQMKNATSVFDRNLEERLDKKRKEHGLVTLRTRREATKDFSSNDFLSLSSSGTIRKEFLAELEKNPNFRLGSTSSRVLDGNDPYVQIVEDEVAAFHKAEAAIIVNSGFEANGVIFSAIPVVGDVIVYDELVHASVHDGMRHTLASAKLPFMHNDTASFREVLQKVKAEHSLISQGERCVLVSIETIYSMDGDISPIVELMDIAKEIFPAGNAQFIIDEAHSTGVCGPNGAGLLAELALERHMSIPIRMHTFGKALASYGAVILSNQTVKTALINYGRPIIYTTGPSYPMLAAIRAGYNLLRSGRTQDRQNRVQHLVKLFFRTIQSNKVWNEASAAGILSIPIMQGWETRDFVTHIVPIWTRPRYNHFLVFHLQLQDYCLWAIDHPVVPRGTGRIRLVFHADNTDAEVQTLAELVCGWAQEMLDIESGRSSKKIPSAAATVYKWLGAVNQETNGEAKTVTAGVAKTTSVTVTELQTTPPSEIKL